MLSTPLFCGNEPHLRIYAAVPAVPAALKSLPMPARLRGLLLLLPTLLLIVVLLSWARSYLPDQTFFRSHQGRLLIFFATADYSKMLDQGTQQTVDYCRRAAQGQPLP